jgi:hypothetical protein
VADPASLHHHSNEQITWITQGEAEVIRRADVDNAFASDGRSGPDVKKMP